jgi:anaerobic selenocysteine-containing dehydrogenase
MTADQKVKVIRTVCRECRAACGMLVHVENGRAVRLEIDPHSPMAKDKLCWQSQASLERLYHPDRLHFPLKRTGERGEGKWQRITWEEALGTIAEKFKRLKDNYGAESVAFVKGYYERRCDLVSRLGNAFGTPNIVGIDNTCYIPSASGRLMTYGFDGRPDLSGLPDCVMWWGSGDNPHLKDDAKLIVVNSIRTEAAKQADIWLQPRPGTDLALALGMLNIMVNERLYDKGFVEQWTTGFDKLEKHVQQYPPDKVAEITWIEAEKVVAAARLFAGSQYACLRNGNASEDTYNSTQFARAISIIQAICGLLDRPGGTVQAIGEPIDKEGRAADVLHDLLPPEQWRKKLGMERGHFPVDPLWDTIVNKPAELQSQYLVSSILEGTPYEVQAAFVLGSNPVMTWCNSKRVYEAFKKINFLAVADIVITPTASLADIILPSASDLEADAVLVKDLGMGDTCLQAQQKVVQIEECRSDLEIVISLAGKMGLGEYFWKDLNAYLDAYLEKVGMTFEELRRRTRIISSGTSYRKYLKSGFNTPSGKVEIYSSLCEKWGYEPLPVYHEPRETPFSAPELADEYSLILTSAHDKVYVHSQDRYLETLRKRNPEPLVLIHPDTAQGLGITEGDQVYIENKRGRIIQKATLSEDVDPRVICVAYGWWFPEKGASGQHGWNEANINILTDDSPPYSPEIGSPSMRGFLCKVYKAEPRELARDDLY